MSETKMSRMLFGLLRLRRHVLRKKHRSGLRGTKKDYMMRKEAARVLVHRKLEEWNKYYAVTYHRVAIRDQRSRWGSCSKKGNLNFNYRILLLPERLQDYIIVHELCHVIEFNHSKKFWALVARTIPDHEERRSLLRAHAKRGLQMPLP